MLSAVKMAAPWSWSLWSSGGRGWWRATRGCWLRSSWPGDPQGARLLSQEKRAAETHFGFETVSEEEKGGKGEGGRRRLGGDRIVGHLVCPAKRLIDVPVGARVVVSVQS